VSSNDLLKKEEYNSLINELSNKYSLETYEIQDSITKTISKIYGFENAVVNTNGSIIGIVKTKSYDFELQHYNISKAKHKQFLNLLEQELYIKTSTFIKNKISRIIKMSNQILYGKIKEENGNLLKFKLFNKNGQEINNFFAEINKKDFFTNEIKQELFKEQNRGFLLYIPKREKISLENGILSIKAIRKHSEIVRYIINNRLKSIKEKLGESYGYDKCIINIKTKTITLFLKLYFSNAVKEYFEESLKEYEDFKIVYINNFKKGEQKNERKNERKKI
jgi:hypothetical protein